MKILSALLCILPSAAFASILPENDLDKEDSLHTENARMTEREFQQRANDVIALYKGIVASKSVGNGAELKVNFHWDDSTVNAYAYRSTNGKVWYIDMFGGLARRPEVTGDGYSLVVCHEVGHHLGGFARYDNNTNWAATEGQADYFATQACARALWAPNKAENAALAAANKDTYAKALCDKAWKTVDERNLCYRIQDASKSLATLLAFGEYIPKLNTPDTSYVDETYESHPDAQCRLDTYKNGALCTMRRPYGTIPVTERADEVFSCTESKGFLPTFQARPHCWFAPKL